MPMLLEGVDFIAAIVFVSVVGFGWAGEYVAEQKGRSTTEGMILGGLLGVFGLVILALLPEITSPDNHRERHPELEQPPKPRA